ncbi:MAG: M2 family metallopeptidase [Bacteroidota bacterium]|nr:M2 family metallopeptidase [Bacteroidota bacterium]
MKRNSLYLTFFVLVVSCSVPKTEDQSVNIKLDAQQFLDHYTQEFVHLYYESAEAEWASNTRILEGDTSNAYKTRLANETFAKFTGSSQVIEKTTALLKEKDKLDPLQVKQLENILYAAANNPETIEAVVKRRIKAETVQTERLFGFDYKIGDKAVSTNEIDEILRSDFNLTNRLRAWEASKEVGKQLKEGIVTLRQLRNETVQALGYPDYFTYQVSDYGMDVKEMMELNQKLIQDIWPLYRELHTYARYELANRYKEKNVPEMLPAHWLPNRWGQDWSAMVNVEGIDLNATLAEKGPEWLVEQSERFYISLGFDSLPKSFYAKSSLYPVPPGAPYKKNNHASAWHLDLNKDLRSLMSVEPNTDWYVTTHHELGHIYYFMSYTNLDVPPLLRQGANRAFHEAVGSLMGLAATQKPFLEHLKLIPENTKTDQMQTLLKEALQYVTFIPFSAGVMTSFEHDLYVNNLSPDEFNKRWWELSRKFQGINPPKERGEEYADATSKTHINDDPAQYYDYALSFVLLFQLHDHIAKNILKQDPRATNYYGSKETGKFLHELLRQGSSKDWRELLKETTGEDINAKAMLSYFEPLMAHLKEVNKGRVHTLPEKIL